MSLPEEQPPIERRLMAKDFAKKSKPTPKRSAATKKKVDSPIGSFLKPFGMGTAFGICLCLGLQWFIANDQTDSSEDMEISEATNENRTPELDFYETLANAEVSVSEEAIAYEADRVQYLLQAGSFRQETDADALRVQIILMNLDAEIQTVGQGNDVWHRVLVGPYTERTDMAKTRSTLLEQGIESMLLTQPIETN